MNVEGFTAHVKQGDKVKRGEKLVSFELDTVKNKAASVIIPVIITKGDAISIFSKDADSNTVAGETEVMIVKVAE